MKIATVLACALLLGACAIAPASIEDDRRVLAAQADGWDKALIAKDRAGIEANMAPDFRQIRGGGGLVNREEFIKDFLDPDGSVDPYVVEDFEIRLFGDTALLYGRIHMTGKDGGKPWAAHFRYIDTYVRRNGRWQVVSVQVTPIPKQ
ncbi:MAG: nuclear transport factor 2 family protein [Usitatibacter sp.]